MGNKACGARDVSNFEINNTTFTQIIGNTAFDFLLNNNDFLVNVGNIGIGNPI